MKAKSILSILLIFVLTVLLVIFLVVLMGLTWINTYTKVSEDIIAEYRLSSIVSNIDGSYNYKVTNIDKREGDSEYLMNGDTLIVTADYITWKPFFKIFDFEKSYKLTEISSSYSDFDKQIQFDDKTNYLLNGGTDEVIKTLAANNQIAYIFAERIEKKQVSIKAVDKELNVKVYFDNNNLKYKE